jgi:urate oxidase
MVLASNRYGKSKVRLVKVRRDREPHGLLDLTIDVELEGAFEPVYTEGDNAACIATDTMKNTVYALARHDDIAHIEQFAARLADHFAAEGGVSQARVAIREQPWERVAISGLPHPHAFRQPGGEAWTTVVTSGQRGNAIASGVVDLALLKTTDSGFAGFRRDRYTTLPETDDRIFATSVAASWRYRPGMKEFGARARIREALVETFACHKSRSVQHTLYAMGEAALAACADVTDITLTMPNRHHIVVDLAPFGLDNPNEIFVATDQPHGLIEATVRR